jgi:hypothetical protein
MKPPRCHFCILPRPRRCRAAGRASHREGASLSVASGAHRCLLCRWRRIRRRGRPDRSRAVGAPRPAICYRQPAGCRLPEVPTVNEFLPGFEASNWFGVAAPKSTPPEIVDKLNKEINVALAEPELKARLADLGAAALAGSPADFGKFIAAEAEKWSKVIRAANIKVD